MAFNPNQIPVYAITPKNSVGNIVNATGIGALASNTNGIAIYTAPTAGARVTSLFLTSSDTANRDFFLYVLNGSTVNPIGIVNVPLNSGNASGVLAVDGLDPTVVKGLPIDNNGKRYIELMGSAVLKFSALVAVTATRQVNATVFAEEYA